MESVMRGASLAILATWQRAGSAVRLALATKTWHLTEVTPALEHWPRSPLRDERSTILRLAFYFSWASAASIVFSIALSQLLLILALIALLISGAPLRFPPIKFPLAAFMCLTVLAVAASPDPYGGLPQIRKFLVFGIVVVIFNTFQRVEQIQGLFSFWAVMACVSAITAFFQLWERYRLAIAQNANDYGFYLDGRLTGLASHWMTFGAEQMIVFLLLLAFLLFAPRRKGRALVWASLPVLWLSLVLGLTRSIFLLGLPAGAIYLAWRWRPRMVPIAACVFAAALALSPFTVRDRIISIVQPHREVDSNARHLIMARAGLAMIKAHPWLGIGPEQVGRQFESFVPGDVPRPLPKGWYGHLHNVYLQYAAERGLPALAMMLWFIGKVLYDFCEALRSRRSPPAARWVLHGAIAMILAILAEGLFEHNLGDSEVLTMFLCVIACGYVLPGTIRDPEPA